MHIDFPPRDDPITKIAVQVMLKLGEDFPKTADDQMLKRLLSSTVFQRQIVAAGILGLTDHPLEPSLDL